MKRLRKLIIQLLSGLLGIWLAVRLLADVSIENGAQTLIFAGLILGLINFFIKPIIKSITWPLRLLTLGLFSFVINMLIIWAVDILFPKFVIKGIFPLFWTAVITWTLTLALPFIVPKRKQKITPENPA